MYAIYGTDMRLLFDQMGRGQVKPTSFPEMVGGRRDMLDAVQIVGRETAPGVSRLVFR